MLTDNERARVRRALGFLNTSSSASISLGVPRLIQPLFLVDLAMNHLLQEGEDGVRGYLVKIEALDERIFQSVTRLAAAEVGEIKLNHREPGQLRTERSYWCKRLADELGVPLQAYSLAQQQSNAVRSVPVQLG